MAYLKLETPTKRCSQAKTSQVERLYLLPVAQTSSKILHKKYCGASSASSCTSPNTLTIEIVITKRVSLVLGLSTLLTLKRVGSNLLVIALKSSQVLTSLGEFTLLHTLTNVPVDECTLGVHKVELVGKSGPCLGDGGGVGQHAPIAS
jgi:hypothetical protein